MFAVFKPDSGFEIMEADSPLVREVEDLEIELVGGGLDGACDNNVVCGSVVNIACIAPNASCSTGGANNTGCPNVACDLSVT